MNSDPHINLTFRHEVRLRLPEGRRLLALSLMAKEIARHSLREAYERYMPQNFRTTMVPVCVAV